MERAESRGIPTKKTTDFEMSEDPVRSEEFQFFYSSSISRDDLEIDKARVVVKKGLRPRRCPQGIVEHRSNRAAHRVHNRPS